MKTIWVFPLLVTESQVLSVPAEAEFLSAVKHGDIPTLHALVDPKSPTEPIEILIYGTEHTIDSEALLRDHAFLVFMGVVEVQGIAWHIFIKRRRKE